MTLLDLLRVSSTTIGVQLGSRTRVGLQLDSRTRSGVQIDSRAGSPLGNVGMASTPESDAAAGGPHGAHASANMALSETCPSRGRMWPRCGLLERRSSSPAAAAAPAAAPTSAQKSALKIGGLLGLDLSPGEHSLPERTQCRQLQSELCPIAVNGSHLMLSANGFRHGGVVPPG